MAKRSNKFYLKIIICIFILLIFLIFYSIHYYKSNSNKIEVRIGNLLPLNPDLMEVAKTMENGINLAKEDLVRKYGENLILKIYNENGCTERETALAVQKFIFQKVSIIGSSFCLFGHVPILPLTEANKIITFNTASNPDVTLNKRFAFSTNVEIKDQAAKMAEFAYQTLRARRAITMHLDTPFGNDFSKYFARRFRELGGEFLFDMPNPPDGKKFKTMISRIKSSNPDIIVIAHFGVPLALFIKEVREAGIKTPILGNYETEDLTVLNIAGIASEGVMIATSEPEKQTDKMESFRQKYVRKHGTEPDDIATNAYDSIVLGVESYIKCDGDPDCMAKKLHQVKNYSGVSGTITIKASGAAEKPTEFKIIKNRTFVYIHPQLTPQ